MSYLKKRLTNRMKDPDFRQEWKDSELEYVIARNIIEFRKKGNISQKQLAEMLHTHQSAISRIENADQNVTIGNLKSIAKALNIDVMDIFTKSKSDVNELETIK